MKRSIGIAIAAASLATSLSAQPPALYEPPLPTVSDPAARHFPGGVTMLGDITYSTITGYRPLKLDLYLPPHRAAGSPLIVWIHGGGWEIGNPRADWTYGDWTKVLARLSARGYAVAAVTYRFKGEAGFPAQIDDVHAAIRFLRNNAAQWNIDGGRVYAWGLSAGGHIAALVGTESATRPKDEQVQGVVDWFGSSDFRSAYAQKKAQIGSLLRCPSEGCSAAALDAASPITFVTAQAPPTLIMQGQADNLVTPDQSQMFYDRLRAAGVPATLVMLPGLGHGFTGASPAKLEALLMQTFGFFDTLTGKTAARR